MYIGVTLVFAQHTLSSPLGLLWLDRVGRINLIMHADLRWPLTRMFEHCADASQWLRSSTISINNLTGRSRAIQ